MLKTWTLPKVGAAALATLLGAVLVAPAGRNRIRRNPSRTCTDRSTASPASPKDPKFINLMAPNREVVEAGLSFAYKEAPPVRVGDLIKISPANKTKSGQPEFKVVTAADPKCKPFIGE